LTGLARLPRPSHRRPCQSRPAAASPCDDAAARSPFDGIHSWWIEISVPGTIRAEIVETADLLAGLELDAGNPATKSGESGTSPELTFAASLPQRNFCRRRGTPDRPTGVRPTRVPRSTC
jgi:hypothetical protein